jgi:hypothetical protein
MASVGFVIYTWLLRNWVFLATNVLMLGTALFRIMDLPASQTTPEVAR